MKWLLLVFVTLLVGCAGMPTGLTAVAPITTVGDEAEVINHTTNVDYLAWLLAVVGWMAPSPCEIWKALTDFILRLVGRK